MRHRTSEPIGLIGTWSQDELRHLKREIVALFQLPDAAVAAAKEVCEEPR